MTIGLLFWVIMLILLIFGFLGAKPAAGGTWNWSTVGTSFIVWLLLALLGWQVFGPAIHK
jgi:hypothetical protein